MWEDKVIAVAQGFFVLAMLPSILSKEKPAFLTSLMNVVLVSVITFCLGSLHLWLSMSTALAVDGTWLILAVQKKLMR